MPSCLACFVLFVWGECVCVRVCVCVWRGLSESLGARAAGSSVLCLSQQREPAATAAAYITIGDVALEATPPLMDRDLGAEEKFYFSADVLSCSVSRV